MDTREAEQDQGPQKSKDQERQPRLLFDSCRCRTSPACLTCRRFGRYAAQVAQRARKRQAEEQ